MDSELRMSLAEHLTELRSRLLKCTLTVLALGTASLVFARPLFGLLMQPVLDALPPGSRSLVYTSGIEEINVLMKVGVYAGIFLTTPVILWQLWGFVSPGLYPEEKKFASPFVILGSLAFIGGALFCYFAVLPPMFRFLLREGEGAVLEERLETGRLRVDDTLRFLRIGDLERAGKLSLEVAQELRNSSGGLSKVTTVMPSGAVEAESRLQGLGHLLDAAAAGLGPTARGSLRLAAEKRSDAVVAFGKGDIAGSTKAMDESASLLAGAEPTGAVELADLWKLEKEMALANARSVAQNWTRPMLTMREQLSLVLLMLLAFGVIFELPIVMALLSVVGLVKSSFLFKYQRHAFVVCLIAAAILTPTGDVVNLSLMAGPMILCYELGVLAVWLLERRKARNAASTDLAPLP